MGIVMIKCPATGVGISTGLTADRSRFASSPVFFSRTRCLICQSDHEWFAGDAWLHDSQSNGERNSHDSRVAACSGR